MALPARKPSVVVTDRTTPTKMGRPPRYEEGTVFVGARLPRSLVQRLDAYAAAHGRMSRTEALRRVLEVGLAQHECPSHHADQ